jgi:hypothetical protein
MVVVIVVAAVVMVMAAMLLLLILTMAVMLAALAANRLLGLRSLKPDRSGLEIYLKGLCLHPLTYEGYSRIFVRSKS